MGVETSGSVVSKGLMEQVTVDTDLREGREDGMWTPGDNSAGGRQIKFTGPVTTRHLSRPGDSSRRNPNPTARAPRSALRGDRVGLDKCLELHQPPDGPEPSPRPPVSSVLPRRQSSSAVLPTQSLIQPQPAPSLGPASQSQACPAGTPAMRPQSDSQMWRFKAEALGKIF